jgi:hypothetical protein
MSQIVKGLLFHYSTEQLAETMRARATHHEARAAEKEGALPDLRRAVDMVKASAEAKAVAQMSKGSSYHFDGDQVTELESDIRDHKNKALVFRDMADHLVPNATYELGEAELRRLEIVK